MEYCKIRTILPVSSQRCRYFHNRAIACGITRMVVVIEISAPSREYDIITSSTRLHGLTNTPPVLKNATVAGLPATDDIGVVSLWLFCGMIELGVGMIAICLPLLRPLFAGWSAESIIRSLRSRLSLRSVTSSHSGKHGADRLDSDPSTVGMEMDTVVTAQRSYEGTTTCAYSGQEPCMKPGEHREDTIGIESEVILSHQQI